MSRFWPPTTLRPSISSGNTPRKSLEDNPIPQLEYYPAVGILRIQGPFKPTRRKTRPRFAKYLHAIHRMRTRKTHAPKRSSPLSCGALTGARSLPLIGNGCRPFIWKAGGKVTLEMESSWACAASWPAPPFLVRVEREPANIAAGQPYRITDLELASRLSFLIWSSIPDDELIEVASQNKLHLAAVLDRQVHRMLADPKADALVSNFGDQLLYLRNLPATSPDGVFLSGLGRRIAEWIPPGNRTAVPEHHQRKPHDLLTADYTFLNERLAKHYGIPNIYGSQFRRVALGPDLAYRRGLLGQGSVLALTWVQNFRTSPVKRGVWVLENILGTPPPEPPPNVPALEDSKGDNKIMTLREQMTVHRKNEPCASCHKLMDPIGFALENFDADAKWRTKEGGDGGVPIDTSSVLWDGTKVNGPIELRQALLHYSPQFVRMITEKLMTFALGRGVEYQDMPVIRSIVRDADRDDDRFVSILMGIVKSAPFQMRTKEIDEEVAAATPIVREAK